jgi:hypothetical protein
MSWFFYMCAVISVISAAAIAVLIASCVCKSKELADMSDFIGMATAVMVPVFLFTLLISLGVRSAQIGEYVQGRGNVRNATLLVANDEMCEMAYKVSKESILTSGLVEFTLKPGESRYFTAGYGDFKLLHKRKAGSKLETEYDRLVKKDED